MKLSAAQKGALQRVDHWSEGGTYMPRMRDMRTFEALERKGLIEYCKIERDGVYNGYRRTRRWHWSDVMTTVFNHEGPSGSCQYIGRHEGRSLQLFTIELTEADPLTDFVGDHIVEALKRFGDRCPADHAMIFVRGQKPDDAEWSSDGEWHFSTSVTQQEMVPRFNALVHSMLKRESQQTTVAGLSPVL